jgi:hypothetical protein
MKISQKKRKIGYTHSSVSGFFPFRGKKSIEFESTLERDLLVSLAFNPNVSDVIEQPVTIEYINHNGRAVTYTPDFLVHYHNTLKPILIEVKPHKILIKKWTDLKRKFKVGTSFARSHNWHFKIYDESRIHTIYFKNVQFVNRYRNQRSDSGQCKLIIAYLTTIKEASVSDIINSLFESTEIQNLATVHIWTLIAHHIIFCDMTIPLGLTSTVWFLSNDKVSHV